MSNLFRLVVTSGILFFLSAITYGQFDPQRLLVPLTITDGTSTFHDTLGCDLGATYCIDGMIDTNLYEQELPMIPPLVFDARFVDHRVDTPCLGVGVRLHIQNLHTIDTFRLSITQPYGIYPITVTWQKLYWGFVIWTNLRIGRPGEDLSTYTDMLTDTVFQVLDPSMATLDIIGNGIVFDGIDSENGRKPEGPTLYQNYPNPFNSQTTIRYYLPARSATTLIVYDILGRRMSEFTDPDATPGFQQVDFDARGLASGIYTYFLRTESQTLSKKFIYIK